MLNKSGQLRIIALVMSLIVFLLVWTFALKDILNYWAQKMIIDNSLTGIEAFLMSYINLWVFVGIGLTFVIVAYVGGD